MTAPLPRIVVYSVENHFPTPAGGVSMASKRQGGSSMKWKALFAGALLCVSSVVVAQESKKPEAADHQAGMEAMIKAMTPGEAHKVLNGFAGNWDAKVTMWMAPGAEPLTSAGSAEAKWVLGGRYLEQRFQGSMMGQPFEGIAYTGYDNVLKEYWGTWIDSMSTGLMTSRGRTTDGKTFTFDATMSDPMTGKETKATEKIILHSADHHVFEMWMAGPDGKDFKTMEIAYSRKN